MGGEASESTQFETSLDIGPDIRPRIAMTDKGYDSQANRAASRARGMTAIIPRRENAEQRWRFFRNGFYKRRARIEQAPASSSVSNASPCAARRPTSAAPP
jgi:hypothetical protein